MHEGVRDAISWLSLVFRGLICGNGTTEWQRTLLSRWWGGGGAELDVMKLACSLRNEFNRVLFQDDTRYQPMLVKETNG